MKCRKCGREVSPEDKFCEFCGAELASQTKKNKKLIATIITCVICLSGFGVLVLKENSDKSSRNNMISSEADKKDNVNEKTFEKPEIQEIFKDLAALGVPFEDKQQVEENLDNFLHIYFLYLNDKEYDMDDNGCIMVPEEEVLSYINNTFGFEYSSYDISASSNWGDSFKDGYYRFYNENPEYNIELDLELLSIDKSGEDAFELNFCSYYQGALDRKYCFEAKEADTDEGFYISRMLIEMNDEIEAEKVYAEQIQNAGEVSGERFVSCTMSEITQWPQDAAGYINYILEDIDSDGNKELFIAYVDPEQWSLSVEMWRYDSCGYVFGQEMQIGYVDPFSEIRMYSFYNEKYGAYQIFYSNNSVGSYTGSRGFTAKLLGMNAGSMEEIASWQWDDMMYSDEDYNTIKTDMIMLGIEYLEAGTESFGVYDEEKYQMIVMTKVDVAGNIPSQYVVSLQLLNRQQMQ